MILETKKGHKNDQSPIVVWLYGKREADTSRNEIMNTDVNVAHRYTQ